VEGRTDSIVSGRVQQVIVVRGRPQKIFQAKPRRHLPATYLALLGLFLPRGYATVCRLSDHPSVCLTVRDVQVSWLCIYSWNTSKIIPRLISLCSVWLQHRRSAWSNGNTLKTRVEWDGVRSTKTAISLKQCLGSRLLWRINRKSHTRFQLAPNSMTLEHLERPKRHFCGNKNVLRSPEEKK